MRQACGEFHLLACQPAAGHLVAPGPRMELDGVRAKHGGFLDRLVVRFDEKADENAAVLESGNFWFQVPRVACDIQTPFGRAFFTFLGDKSDRVGHHLLRDADHLLSRGHLKIERDLDGLFQRMDITVLDVTAILAQVTRDIVRAAKLAKDSGLDRVRIRLAASLTDRRDVIDVDAQADHFFFSVTVAVEWLAMARCIVSASSSTMDSIMESSSPSTMIRARFSVPE